MLTAFFISFLLVSATIAIHYEALRQTSLRLGELPIYPRARIIVVIAIAMISHCLHALLYAFAYMALASVGGYGDIGGAGSITMADAFYFSITSYTTLGIGDLYPHGELRIISGIEALNGLVMVGWTASYTYLAMERYWHVAVSDDEMGDEVPDPTKSD